MTFQLKDFYPKYPNIYPEPNSNLNPYEKQNFYDVIFRKKEFYDLRLDKKEEIPQEKGSYYKHQLFVSRFLSSYTGYNELFLIHYMGTGKTCSAVALSEFLINNNSKYDKVYVIVKNTNMKSNWENAIINTCTDLRFKLNDREKRISSNFSKLKNFYNIYVASQFSHEIKNVKLEILRKRYSNSVFIFDEIHGMISEKPDKEEKQDNPYIIAQKQTIDTYNQIKKFCSYRFIPNGIVNTKILLLSGTPMRDQPDEFADIMNLILPPNQKLEKDFFIKGKLDNFQQFRKKVKGRISFLRSEMPAKKSFKGIVKKFVYDEVKLYPIILYPIQMSEFQKNIYLQGMTEKKRFGNMKKTLRSLAVFPNKTHKSGEYIQHQKLSNAFIKELKVKDDPQATIQNVFKYSCKYFTTLNLLNNTYHQNKNGKAAFVYCRYISNGGIILLKLLLELIGYKNAGNMSKEQIYHKKAPRFLVFRGKLNSEQQEQKMIQKEYNKFMVSINKFNTKKNVFGEYIQVIIGSDVVSEGFSFHNIQTEIILTPNWNFGVVDQALARGIRVNSHTELIKQTNNPNPKVDIYLLAACPYPIGKESKNNIINTIDYRMYAKSLFKDKKIRQVLFNLLISSVDCGLNYKRNFQSQNPQDKKKLPHHNKDGTPECFYNKCYYGCDGLNNYNLLSNNPLKPDQIDHSTYDLYYTDIKDNLLRQQLKQLFFNKNSLTGEQIIAEFSTRKYFFSDSQIKNALVRLLKDSQNMKAKLYYFDYLKEYDTTDIKMTINAIISMFKNSFYLELPEIHKNIKRFIKNINYYILIKALFYIIDTNQVIENKYGNYSFLRQYKNIYFLVSSLLPSNYFLSYYTKYPCLTPNIIPTFDYSIEDRIKRYLTLEYDFFTEKIKNIPVSYKLQLLQTAIIAYVLHTQFKIPNPKFSSVQKIMTFFKDYYHIDSNNMYVITLQQYKCQLVPITPTQTYNKIWGDCDKDIKTRIINQDSNELDRIIQQSKQLGFYGKLKPPGNTFLIVLHDAKTIRDKRKKSTGKNCNSFKQDQLLQFVTKLNPSYNIHNIASTGLNKILCDKILEELNKKNLVYTQKSQTLEKKDNKQATKERVRLISLASKDFKWNEWRNYYKGKWTRKTLKEYYGIAKKNPENNVLVYEIKKPRNWQSICFMILEETENKISIIDFFTKGKNTLPNTCISSLVQYLINHAQNKEIIAKIHKKTLEQSTIDQLISLYIKNGFTIDPNLSSENYHILTYNK